MLFLIPLTFMCLILLTRQVTDQWVKVAELKYGSPSKINALEEQLQKVQEQLNTIDGEELLHLRSDISNIKVQLGLSARRK